MIAIVQKPEPKSPLQVVEGAIADKAAFQDSVTALADIMRGKGQIITTDEVKAMVLRLAVSGMKPEDVVSRLTKVVETGDKALMENLLREVAAHTLSKETGKTLDEARHLLKDAKLATEGHDGGMGHAPGARTLPEHAPPESKTPERAPPERKPKVRKHRAAARSAAAGEGLVSGVAHAAETAEHSNKIIAQIMGGLALVAGLYYVFAGSGAKKEFVNSVAQLGAAGGPHSEAAKQLAQATAPEAPAPQTGR
ncbi:MAG: hypothetical protein K2Q01_01775 [Rickettsiales bacterium]|nr:hypothetical protein [Rickettsiales bacterium]